MYILQWNLPNIRGGQCANMQNEGI